MLTLKFKKKKKEKRDLRIIFRRILERISP